MTPQRLTLMLQLLRDEAQETLPDNATWINLPALLGALDTALYCLAEENRGALRHAAAPAPKKPRKPRKPAPRKPKPQARKTTPAPPSAPPEREVPTAAFRDPTF